MNSTGAGDRVGVVIEVMITERAEPYRRRGKVALLLPFLLFVVGDQGAAHGGGEADPLAAHVHVHAAGAHLGAVVA